jgi:hypothetical protein
MNQRINELAEQAGVTGYFAAGTEYATPIPLSDEVQKFAELIVLECMRLVGNKTCPNYAYKAIENHFGITNEQTNSRTC